MFGNGFRARVGAEFFAASSSEFQWYCLPSAYVVLHDSMLVRCAFPHAIPADMGGNPQRRKLVQQLRSRARGHSVPLVPDNASKAAVDAMVDAVLGIPNLPDDERAAILQTKAEFDNTWASASASGAQQDAHAPDATSNKVLTKAQFRQRAAQILKSYEEKAPGQSWSRLQKLVRGMPARLARSKARRYGRCGK